MSTIQNMVVWPTDHTRYCGFDSIGSVGITEGILYGFNLDLEAYYHTLISHLQAI
jgi:hypothetical protein